MKTQKERYEKFYEFNGFRWLFRFDVHYRCKRMHEKLKDLSLSVDAKRVMDFGFGNAAMLKTFPKSCSIVGMDVSKSAVENAKHNDELLQYADCKFVLIDETKIPYCDDEFDYIISSHSLEHTIDDEATLDFFYEKLAKNGYLLLFVPVEEPDYIRYHSHTYSLPSIQNKCKKAGFHIVFAEGSMHINGHIWKLLTIPSRREWPVLSKCVDGFRLLSLSLLPYSIIKRCDCFLDKLAFSPRQAFVIAKKNA
ncbi:MAG: class I SAM-dependent methyltransferase [Bradymonadales bacterium]